VAEFGIKALIGGTVACFITAAIAGMIVSESSFLF
jgi:nucleoside permease NupC